MLAAIDQPADNDSTWLACRADRVLRYLLGRSYSRQDIAFYGTALCLSLMATAVPATGEARKWLLALVAGSLAAERLLCRLLASWTDVGRLLQLPPLLGQPEGMQVDFVLVLRW